MLATVSAVHLFKATKKKKNYFSQLLNVHRVSDIKQIEIHTAQFYYVILVLLRLKFQLKSYKSQCNDPISAELIQAGGEILRSEIHKRH
jgi:hypothetical protein